MILPFEEREYAPFENRLKSQVSPLSVEVSMPAFSAAKSLVPARAKELTPVKANCSTTSQEAPSSVDLQMKLSSATMIALSLTIISLHFLWVTILLAMCCRYRSIAIRRYRQDQGQRWRKLHCLLSQMPPLFCRQDRW